MSSAHRLFNISIAGLLLLLAVLVADWALALSGFLYLPSRIISQLWLTFFFGLLGVAVIAAVIVMRDGGWDSRKD